VTDFMAGSEICDSLLQGEGGGKNWSKVA